MDNQKQRLGFFGHLLTRLGLKDSEPDSAALTRPDSVPDSTPLEANANLAHGEPPAHWLAMTRSGEPPAHWLEAIQARIDEGAEPQPFEFNALASNEQANRSALKYPASPLPSQHLEQRSDPTGQDLLNDGADQTHASDTPDPIGPAGDSATPVFQKQATRPVINPATQPNRISRSPHPEPKRIVHPLSYRPASPPQTRQKSLSEQQKQEAYISPIGIPAHRMVAEVSPLPTTQQRQASLGSLSGYSAVPNDNVDTPASRVNNAETPEIIRRPPSRSVREVAPEIPKTEPINRPETEWSLPRSLPAFEQTPNPRSETVVWGVWPDLPDVTDESQPDDLTWSQIRREWKRQQRLDREQRGLLPLE